VVTPPAPADPPADTGDTTGTPVTISGGRVKVKGRLRKATAPITVTSPAAETAGSTGRVTLTSAGKVKLGGVKVVAVLGSKAYTLRPGQTRRVNVRLPSTLRKIARGKRTLKVRASAVDRDAAGNLSEASKRLTLRLPRK